MRIDRIKLIVLMAERDMTVEPTFGLHNLPS